MTDECKRYDTTDLLACQVTNFSPLLFFTNVPGTLGEPRFRPNWVISPVTAVPPTLPAKVIRVPTSFHVPEPLREQPLKVNAPLVRVSEHASIVGTGKEIPANL